MKYNKAIKCLNREIDRLQKIQDIYWSFNAMLNISKFDKDIQQIKSAIKLLEDAQKPKVSKHKHKVE